MPTQGPSPPTTPAPAPAPGAFRPGFFAWRSQAVVRIRELGYEVERIRFRTDAAPATEPQAPADTRNASHGSVKITDAGTLASVSRTLSDAEDRANRRGQSGRWRTLISALTGADVEFVWRAIHAADVELLYIAGDLAGRSAEIDAAVTTYLPAADSRRDDLHRRFLQGQGTLRDEDRGAAVAAYRAALAELDNQQKRVRSFRNTLLVASVVLAVAAVLLAVLAAGGALNLCTAQRSCPTGIHPTGPKSGDAILVELLGAAAAILVGATSLSRTRGTSSPYAVLVLTALLKVPAGALTAVLGLVLILADFGPGIKLDTTAQVDAWAVLFGAAQQTFTQLVDRQAQTVLNNVGGTDKASPQNQSG